jgi:hypothetical protein
VHVRFDAVAKPAGDHGVVFDAVPAETAREVVIDLSAIGRKLVTGLGSAFLPEHT